MNYLLGCYFLFWLTVQSVAQENPSSLTLQELFNQYDKKELFFVNGLLRKEGKTVEEYSAGFQHVEKDIKNSKVTRFMIGSITKTYTATLVMQLVEEGKIRLDETIDAYFPNIPNASSITVEMLLRHRSGLFNYTNNPSFYELVAKPITSEQLIQSFDTLRTDFPAGTKFEYSNTNYILLGKLVEKVTNDTYENQLQKRILVPLQLTNTYMRTGNENDTDRAISHVNHGKWHAIPEWSAGWAWSSGEIVATAEDVALFYEGLFAGKLVKEATLQQMMHLQDGYGMGLAVIPYHDQQLYGHSGKIENFLSIVTYNPKDRTTMVRLINGVSKYNDNDVSIQLLNALYGQPIESPINEVAVSILESYVGEYTAENFPLAIKVFLKDGELFGQATGQGPFPLSARNTTKFEFPPAYIQIEFVEQEGKRCFKYKQGPYTFLFVRN